MLGEFPLLERIREREIEIVKVNREAISVSHGLAFLGKVQAVTNVWLQDYPPEIARAIKVDCTVPNT
jgi:hypothetical protein